MYKWVQYFLQRESFHLKYRIFSFINSDRYTIFTALWLFSYKAGSYLFDIGPESLRLLSYEFYGFFFVLQRENFNYGDSFNYSILDRKAYTPFKLWFLRVFFVLQRDSSFNYDYSYNYSILDRKAYAISYEDFFLYELWW